MSFSVRQLAATLAFAAVAGCGDSTGVQPADLEGTWQVSEVVYSADLGDFTAVVIMDFTPSAVIVIESGGAFQKTITIGGDHDSDSGILTVTGNEVEMDFGTGLAAGTITRDGDAVTIVLDRGVEFDVDGNGTDDPATAQIVMVRR
jgi:hypothetical protein